MLVYGWIVMIIMVLSLIGNIISPRDIYKNDTERFVSFTFSLLVAVYVFMTLFMV